jgi:hypothetical protein
MPTGVTTRSRQTKAAEQLFRRALSDHLWNRGLIMSPHNARTIATATSSSIALSPRA